VLLALLKEGRDKLMLHGRLATSHRDSTVRTPVEGAILANLLEQLLNSHMISDQLQSVVRANVGALAATGTGCSVDRDTVLFG
jgi:hypothetical protein